MEQCACGIPNRANYYVGMVIVKQVPGGTETEYVDAYACAEHMSDDPADVLYPDIKADGWEVAESTVNHLR